MMFQKILCAFGFHTWDYSPPGVRAELYGLEMRRCIHCYKLQQRMHVYPDNAKQPPYQTIEG